MRILWATVLLNPFLPTGLAAAGQMVTNETTVHGIVKKALPSIVSGANEWMAENDCVTCHRVTHAAWALNLATEHLGTGADTGITSKQVWQINQWATNWTKLAKPDVRANAVQNKTLQNNADTVGQAILAVATVRNSLGDDWENAYYASIIEGQKPAGFWNAGGQLPMQKRAVRETNEVTTMWTLVALNTSSLSSPKQDSIEHKATQWLTSKESVTAGQSTEWWALKSLLNETDTETSQEDLPVTQLLSFQNSDGGWGWLVNDDSDALGTGIALYALAQHATPAANQARNQAIDFLRTTQLPNGSWNVKGTKKNGRNKIVDTASYWGTCWAVIGLLQSP